MPASLPAAFASVQSLAVSDSRGIALQSDPHTCAISFDQLQLRRNRVFNVRMSQKARTILALPAQLPVRNTYSCFESCPYCAVNVSGGIDAVPWA